MALGAGMIQTKKILFSAIGVLAGFLAAACDPQPELTTSTYVCDVDADCPPYQSTVCINYFSYYFSDTSKPSYPKARPLQGGHWGVCTSPDLQQGTFEFCENGKDDNDNDQVDCDDPACRTYKKCLKTPPEKLFPFDDDCDPLYGVKMTVDNKNYCFPRCGWSYFSETTFISEGSENYCNTFARDWFDFSAFGIQDNLDFKCVYVRPDSSNFAFHDEACLPAEMNENPSNCTGEWLEIPYSANANILNESMPTLDATATYCIAQ